MAKGRQISEPLPYYKWYWRDWRGSRAVQKMTALERGIYRELLDEQWRLGSLKNDREWLANAALCTSEEIDAAWPVLAPMFQPLDGTDGQLIANDRLEAERTEADRQRVSRAVAGSLGGKAKASAKHVLAPAKHLPYSSSRAEQSSSTEQTSASDARPGAAASSAGDEPASPEQIRAILDSLRGMGGGRALDR